MTPNFHECVPSTSDTSHTYLSSPNLNLSKLSSCSIASPNVSLCSNDFTYESDDCDSCDSDRGLNFYSVPSSNNMPPSFSKIYSTSGCAIPVKTMKFQFPCLVCGRACIDNRQNSICCNICDEWVHLKCTDLSLEQFHALVSPDHTGTPYYCTNCLYGSTPRNRDLDSTTGHAALCSILDSNDMYDLCPNSLFKDKDDITISDYYSVNDVNNLDIELTRDNLLLIHINADSLYTNYSKLTNLIDQLKMYPSLIFISETRVHDSDTEMQLSQIRIDGYTSVLHNSPTPKGGTAIYVSDKLKYQERTDIKFNHPSCEACFIEITCEGNNPNPIFGALYRHPDSKTQTFNNRLGEFLEDFTARKTKLTLFGDTNIDLNKSNPVSNEYINAVNSAGFTTLINQPTNQNFSL